MRVLLTGANGFLGSHLLKELLKNKYDVVVLKRSASDISRIASEIKECSSYDVDIVSVGEAFNAEPINVVVHCATTYGSAEKNAADFLKTNVIFPMELLETAIANQCRYFVNTSSFFCRQIPSRINCNEPVYKPEYTLSKYQFNEWGRLRAGEGKINFINLQLEHIYGDNDSESKFVPWVEKQLKNNVSSINLTDGIQIRDFINVKDVVQAYLCVLSSLEEYQGYCSVDIGTGTAVTVRQFIEGMKKDLHSKTKLNFGAVPRAKSEIMCSFAKENWAVAVKQKSCASSG